MSEAVVNKEITTEEVVAEVVEEPEKAYEYSQNPIVQDVFSYKVTQKA